MKHGERKLHVLLFAFRSECSTSFSLSGAKVPGNESSSYQSTSYALLTTARPLKNYVQCLGSVLDTHTVPDVWFLFRDF